jgi:signal peptidase I
MSDTNKPEDETPRPEGSAEGTPETPGADQASQDADPEAAGAPREIADEPVDEPIVAQAPQPPEHQPEGDPVEPAASPEPAAAPTAPQAGVTPDEAAPEPEAPAGEPAAPQPLAPEPVSAAAASVAPEAAAPAARPIWSDQGDAPFDDGSATTETVRRGRRKSSSSGGGFFSELWDIGKTVFYALVIALILRTVLFQPFTIPSASMEPNLYEGDYIVVSKWSYGYSRHATPISLPENMTGRLFGRGPERGDIVVFKLPTDNRTDYIKRVIGLPGDEVQMIGGLLHINGEPVGVRIVDRSQIETPWGLQSTAQVLETMPEGREFLTQDFGPSAQLDNTRAFRVPEGHYFMMGDNRDNSVDSRDAVGMVPADNLIGKAEIILFSWSPGASLTRPWTWFGNLRPSRFFTVLQ